MSARTWYRRVAEGIAHSFPERWIEWLMAIWAIVWASRWIIDPGNNFSTASGAWDGLAFFFRADWVFAGIMVLFGTGRLAALTINGTFSETVYARYSPVVRAITAVLCGLCWLFLWVSAVPSSTQGGVTFIFPVLIEFITAIFVVDESADVLREWRHGRSRS